MASTTSSGAATPRSKLDTLSREDLVRFVKKQVQNLQAAKQKIDALEARIAEVPAVGDDGERLQDENDRLRVELEALRSADAQHTAQHDVQAAELDRLRTQLHTTEQTVARMSALQEDFLRLTTAKEELERDNRAISERDAQRNEQLEHLSTALSASDERIRLIDAQLKDAEADKERLQDKLSSIESEFMEKCQCVVALQEECQLLRKALNERGELCDEMHDETERLVAELDVAHRVAGDAVEQYKEEIGELQRQLADARDQIQRLVGVPVEEKPIVVRADRACSTEDDVTDREDSSALVSETQCESGAESQQQPAPEEATAKEEEMSSLIRQLQVRVTELEAEQRAALLAANAEQQDAHRQFNERILEVSAERDALIADREQRASSHNKDVADTAELQLALTQSKEECARLNTDLLTLRSESDLRLQTIADLNAEIASLKEQLTSVQNQLLGAKSAFVDMQAKHEATLKSTQETVALLSSENEQLCVDADLLREKLAHSSKQSDTRDGHVQTEIVAETFEGAPKAEVSQASEAETASLRLQLAEEEDHVRSLRTELDGIKQLLREQSSLVDQVTTQCDQRQTEIERLRKESNMYKEQLDAIKEKASTQNVLSLEMADYERSVERLQEDLKRSQELVQSKSNESSSIKKELDALRSQKAKTESNLAKLKTAFVKTRLELTTAQTDLEKKTAECDGLSDKLQEVTADVESMKMELSSSMAGEHQRLAQLETTVSSLQRQLTAVHSQRESLQRQYDDLTAEYETFKTRAHSVLKQQNKTSSEQEQAEEERVRLNKMIVDLEKRLQETNVGYRTAQEELSAVQDDYERVSERFRRVQTEADDKLATLQRQLTSQRAEYETRLANELATVDRLQTRQRDIDKEHTLTIEKLREAHAREIAEIRERLAVAEAAVGREEKTEANDDAPNAPMPPVTERAPAEGQEAIIAAPVIHRHQHVGHRRMHRGTVDSDDLSGRQSRNSIPLEDLLMADDLSVASTVTSPIGDVEDAWLAKTEKAMRRLEHTTELLHETEATNARLVEQTKLLKDEIRRLERNKEREQHVANCEYLKNVVMKFLAPQQKVNDERPQLIPILTTMLRLGPDEVDLLNKIANNGGDGGQQSAGWGGYLHRWSGLT